MKPAPQMAAAADDGPEQWDLPAPPLTLDPQDWERFRSISHQALDRMITHLASIETRPVWRPVPGAVRQSFAAALPRRPRDLDDVLEDFRDTIEPYATGNTHPLFFGWVHGAGTPVGMLAEMLAAGLNANCGGRDHIGIEVERQIARWAAELFSFPREASGIFVTGTSMANFLGVRVAATKAFGPEVRSSGWRLATAQPVAYTSEEAHGCIAQALELSGIGSANLRSIPVDAGARMRIDDLAAAIAADRRAGNAPFLIVGTAGAVNGGAIDDLEGLAETARREGLWLHIDGAFGALAALCRSLAPRLRGIERADSIAFDFHKWAHVPYDAGFFLVRDPEMHRRTFAAPAAYLQKAQSGLAAGGVWPCELGPDLSRGFRALKTWFTFQTLGADRIGACIEQCCRLAGYLERRLRAMPMFEVVGVVSLNIVCWRVRGADEGINQAIMMDLHERGIAVPSLTRLAGRAVLRAAIVNHRTNQRHIDTFVDALVAATDRALATQPA